MFSRKIIWLALCAALPVSLHALADDVSPPQARVQQAEPAGAENGEPVDVLLAEPAAAPEVKPVTEPEPVVTAAPAEPEAKPAAEPAIVATPEVVPEPPVVVAPESVAEPEPVVAAAPAEPETKPAAEPVIVATPEPAPEVKPVAQPEPVVAAAPAEPEAKPAAEPAIVATPEVVPEPPVVVAPESVAEPEPVVAVTPAEPETKPAAEPVVVAAPEPAPSAAPVVSAAPEVVPEVKTAAEPVVAVEPELEPVAAPVVAAEPEVKPVAVPEPAVAVAPVEPEVKSAAEPVAAPEPAPQVKPVAVPEPAVAAAPAEPEVKPAAEPVVVAAPEPASTAAPVVSAAPEVVPEPTPAVEVKTAAEPVVVAAPDPEPEVKPVSVPEPAVAAAPAKPEVKPAVEPVVVAAPEVVPEPTPAVEVKTAAEPVVGPEPVVTAVPEVKPAAESSAVLVAPEAKPAAEHGHADAPSKAFAAAQASVKAVALENEFKPPADVKPRVDSTVIPGGPLQVVEKPSVQELLERAKYWDSRGRHDIADKLRNQYRKETHEDAADAAARPAAARSAASGSQGKEVVVRTPPAVVTVAAERVAAPSSQELRERAKYWEVRGRTDLAEKLNAQAVVPKPVVAAIEKPAPLAPVSVRSVPVAAETSKSTEPSVRTESAKPDSDARAQYWAARGRVDLAQPGDAVPAKAASVARADSRMQLATQEKPEPVVLPTAQQLDASAQYWDARGRPDLASQVRAKLQQIEPAPRPRVGANDRSAVSDGRSALEDSLLKNPNSLKARLDLAQIYRSAGEMGRAREMIDSVLRGNPDLPDALYASAQLYAEQHLWWEVLHTLEKVSPVSRTAEMGRLQKVAWAHVQIDRADALVRQGDNVGAEVLLRRVAAELVVSYNQAIQPEPPPLWGSEQPAKQMKRRDRR